MGQRAEGIECCAVLGVRVEVGGEKNSNVKAESSKVEAISGMMP